MGAKYMDSAKAAAEADRIAAIAGQNLKQVLLTFRNCLQVVHKTRRMLEVDPGCVCMNGESKWERRRELHEAADSIAMEIVLRNPLNEIDSCCLGNEIVASKPSFLGDDSKNINLSWCDRVCVHEKVDMDSALWCNTPQTILELVFARLPLHQIFQLRGLSKHWRASIMSPSFQSAFGTTTSRRFAIIAGSVRKRLWSFGTTERKWYTLPFDFLPAHCDFPVAGDGGLLCCRRPALPSRSNQVKAELQLYVCNPLTRAWRKLPLPSLVQELDLVHMVFDKQTRHYTITVVNDLQLKQHIYNVQAIVEVYDSATNTWTASTGIFRSQNNLIYYKKYVSHEFVGIRAYDKSSGYTSIPLQVPPDIVFSEGKGFFPLAEYQGQIYVLQTDAATSGVWVLRGRWERICSVPKPEILKFYLFSLYVSADVIIIFGDKRIFHDDIEIPVVADSDEPESPYTWMLDRAQGKWIDVVDHELDSFSCSQIMFEMRLDGIP